MGDAAPEQSDQEVHTRSLFMTKTASMAWLDLQGTAARKFCMTQNVMRKILLPEHATKNEAYISDANNMLRRVHVQRLTVECGTVNNFPFPIGVRISNFPAQEFSSSGEGFSYIIPAKHSIPVSLPIFESHGDETMQATWDQEYSKWTIDNLDTLMAMTVPESDVMLVHLEHPVLQILERRPDYFKVGVQTMTASSTPNWKHVQVFFWDDHDIFCRISVASLTNGIRFLSQPSMESKNRVYDVLRCVQSF